MILGIVLWTAQPFALAVDAPVAMSDLTTPAGQFILRHSVRGKKAENLGIDLKLTQFFAHRSDVFNITNHDAPLSVLDLALLTALVDESPARAPANTLFDSDPVGPHREEAQSASYGSLGRVFPKQVELRSPIPNLRKLDLHALVEVVGQIQQATLELKNAQSQNAVTSLESLLEEAAITGGYAHEVLQRAISAIENKKAWVKFSAIRGSAGKALGMRTEVQFVDPRGAQFEADIPSLDPRDLDWVSRYENLEIYEDKARQGIKAELSEGFLNRLKALDRSYLGLAQEFIELREQARVLPDRHRTAWIKKLREFASRTVQIAAASLTVQTHDLK